MLHAIQAQSQYIFKSHADCVSTLYSILISCENSQMDPCSLPAGKIDYFTSNNMCNAMALPSALTFIHEPTFKPKHGQFELDLSSRPVLYANVRISKSANIAFGAFRPFQIATLMRFKGPMDAASAFSASCGAFQNKVYGAN